MCGSIAWKPSLQAQRWRRSLGANSLQPAIWNVWLVVPNDEGVFHGAAEREGRSWVFWYDSRKLSRCSGTVALIFR